MSWADYRANWGYNERERGGADAAEWVSSRAKGEFSDKRSVRELSAARGEYMEMLNESQRCTMKSLSMGDETGNLAEPRCISARVKNRNPTVPCWLSFMSAALVTKLVASEPLPLQSSIYSLISFTFYLFFSVQFSFTLVSFFSSPLLISTLSSTVWSLFISPILFHFMLCCCLWYQHCASVRSLYSSLPCCHTNFITCLT